METVKKVLIVLYYWPPAGGPGVQRWLKFIKYLNHFKVHVTVFTPKNPFYPITDQSLIKEIPKGIKIIQSSIFEPYTLASFLSKNETNTMSKGIIQETKKQSIFQKSLLYIRGNMFIPDARKFWIKPSIKKISTLIKKEKFNTIITTGPPHSIHCIGYGVKVEHPAIKWIADFRDPWTNIGYHKQLKLTKKSVKKHLALEKKVLLQSDHIIVTSPSTSKEFSNKTPKPISLLTNGYDDSILTSSLDKKFTIVHTGTLLSERNPHQLWIAIRELIDENEQFRQKFALKLVGQVSQSIVESIHAHHLKDFLTLTGYLPHQEAQQQMYNAQVLLLIEKNMEETKGIIPGKFFEYLQAERPILAIGPENWDVSQLIQQHKCGESFLYSDKAKIKVCLLSYFNKYQQGQLKVNSENIQQYHRKELTKRLSEIIHLDLQQ